MSKFRWQYLPVPSEDKIKELQKVLGISEPLAAILVQRGVETFDEAKAFFRPDLNTTHPPLLMKDMDKAVKRIVEAITNGEPILVYGDYDVDGTTAVTMMYDCLKKSHDFIHYYIPDRYTEGYGISLQGIDFAYDNNFSLIIALDCGIKAIKQVEYAKEKGIDFIICDHHQPGAQIPNAVAVLDPKRKDCEYPFKELSGAGVGFKLLSALSNELHWPEERVLDYLDLLVVSIAADIVPILDENRAFAHFGLFQINQLARPGIKAMLPETKWGNVNITDLVFNVAPKINAAGRIEHALGAVELLLSKDDEQAKERVISIETLNEKRKSLDANITVEALEQIKENQIDEAFSTVVYHERWHKGVLGIVASRLIETHYRPTVVFTKDEHSGRLVASARSVKGFDLYEALAKCEDLIEQFGGHKYAAGLKILPDNLLPFQERFEEVVENSIKETERIPTLPIDWKIDLQDLTPKFIKILKQFAPFGPQNMRPVFHTSNVYLSGSVRQMGKTKEHLKFQVFQPGLKNTFTAVGFRMGEYYELLEAQKPFDIAYSIEENHWNGQTYLQLELKDIIVQ